MGKRNGDGRGYALLIVMLVLALMSVGLGTLFYFLEASAATTGSMLERRRVFYACDGIGRAATVLAQNYMVTAVPSTPALIESVCAEGGGGCCASTTAGGACAPPPSPGAVFTSLTAVPPLTALPRIVPAGFSLTEFSIASLAPPCVVDTDCVIGSCVLSAPGIGTCRAVSPLPNGPFQGMNARQDVISIALKAEHTATSGFACRTRQTISLGKIAMFQFFLFSDSQYTDWHPGPAMRATGRMHANGDLAIRASSPLLIERVTAAGDLRCMNGTGPELGDCAADTAAIANRLNPDFTNPAHFTDFRRTNATWTQDALNDYGNGNAQDRAHGVPRLQLPVIGSPLVQRGFDAANNLINNTNTVAGVDVTNSRLLIDPVRLADAVDVRGQKFAHKSDIRIINGVWYLRNPANPNLWPGVPIWSDHAISYTTRAATDFVPGIAVGQDDLAAVAALGWAGRVPQRFSYYGALPTSNVLAYDDTVGPASPPVGQRAVVSYGALFRDASAGEASAVWRPGARTLRSGRLEQNAAGSRNASGAAESFCEDFPAGSPAIFSGMLDVLALSDPAANVDPCPVGLKHPTRAAGLIAATRSGFRNGYTEFNSCGSGGNSDRDNVNHTSCDLNGETADRRDANVLPINFDLHAFQEALGDTTPGELGSFFCPAGTPTCGAFMGAPFNGIVYIAAPYPAAASSVATDLAYRDPGRGSERGYGAGGGVDTPFPLRAPTQSTAHMSGVGGDDVTSSPTVAGDLTTALWDTTADLPLPILVDNAGHAVQQEFRDEEVAALPFALCTETLTAPFDMTGISGDGWRFLRPGCANPASRADDARMTWVNGVRIINARRVNKNTPPTVAPPVAQAAFLPAFPSQPVLSATGDDNLPNGISIVTNLPAYVVGDVNITSDAFATGNEPWVPVLIAADVVHPLSNFWDDSRASWAVSTASATLETGEVRQAGGGAVAEGPAGGQRPAMVTRYNMEILGGWGMTVAGSPSGGIHNFPRFLEDWGSGNVADCKGGGVFLDDCPAIITGSIVIGHNRVYTLGIGPENTPGNIGRSPPRRDWGFDRHLEDLQKQPPGAPVYDVAAIKQWTRN